jgi:hypothetical protein
MELNFLPLSHRKGISMPKVVFEPFNNQGYGGYYLPNIVVVVEPPPWAFEDKTDAVLAHEFRHHTQYVTGSCPSVYKGSSLDFSLDYEQMVTKYFKTYPHEMDALLYEVKYAKSEISDWWLRKLVLP